MLTRREWLATTVLPAVAWLKAPADSGRETRIRRVIATYEKQGVHRTATEVDRASAEWLAREVRDAGLTPALEAFAIQRIDLIEASLVADGRRIAGVPLFDGGFTGAGGVRGRLAPIDDAGEIALAETAVNAAAAGALGRARRANRHRAIVGVTRGGRPGLCPSNAEFFLNPFGPPVLQVSSEEGAYLENAARRGIEVQITAEVKRTTAQAFNVTASLAGTNRAQPPLIVMTPRSGWWACASERGGGIACWLEVMRELRGMRPARDILFVASSGHELGHLGINAFIDRRPGIVRRSVGWMHFGANIGAAQDPGNNAQASDEAFESQLTAAMGAAGLDIDRRSPRGTVPGGEAEAVHRGGGRYVSIIGRNALFHNPQDRGPDAVNVSVVARFVEAFTIVAKGLSA